MLKKIFSKLGSYNSSSVNSKKQTERGFTLKVVASSETLGMRIGADSEGIPFNYYPKPPKK